MTVLSAVQVADYWVSAGGPKDRAVEWVAIAIGESDFDDQVVSPAGAIGVWQIMPFNAPTYGYSPADLYNPAVNARVTVLMSGGGTNCAAWDSAYRDIYASGRYTFLAWPEVGSADYDHLATAAALLGGEALMQISTPRFPGVNGTLPAAIDDLQRIGGRAVPALTAKMSKTTRAITTMYRTGGR